MFRSRDRGIVIAIAVLMALGPVAGTALAQDEGPPEAWEQEAKLEPENGGLMGRSVDLDGSTAIVGAPADGETGAAYIFENTGGTWSQQARLTPDNDDAHTFGSGVAIDGDTALVGDIENPPGQGGEGTQIQEGAAYVFTRSNSGAWTQQTQLLAPSPEEGSLFGEMVALEGDTAIVGAENDDTSAGEDAGAVYVYTRSADIWSHAATLTASDASAGDRFGKSLALDTGVLLVGAPDATTVYTFTGSGSSWTEAAQLVSSDDLSNFGSSVDLDASTGIVGARGPGGAAFVFDTVTQSGSEDAVLIGDDPFAQATSVALSGDLALVGDFGVTNEKVNVFHESGSEWSEVAELQRWDAESQVTVLGGFGSTVAVEGGTALVGAPAQDTTNGSDAGVTYVFEPCSHDTAPSQAVHDNVRDPLSGIEESVADDFHEVNCHRLD